MKEELRADFPSEAYSEDNSRGFPLTSIKAAYVIERLNDVFGLCGKGWKYEISPFKETLDGQGNIVEVGTKIKFQWKMKEGEWSEPIPHVGGKRVVKNNITDARKSSITDALTKVASVLGVGDKVFKGLVKTNGEKKFVKKPFVKSAPTAPPGVYSNKVSDKQKRMIFALAKQNGLEADDAKTTYKTRYKLESFNDLTKTQASEVIDELQKFSVPEVEVHE